MPELDRFESRPLVPVRHGSPPIADAARRVPTVRVVGPGWRHIQLKLLLVTATGTEPSFLAARSALDRIATPYDVLIASTTALTAAMLSPSAGECNYRGVIIAVGGLGFLDPGTQLWTSAFTAAEWTILADFERACSAREVVWYGLPDAEHGLALSSSFTDAEPVTAKVTSAGTGTAAAPGVFSYVPVSADVPITNAFGSKATITDTAATTALIQSEDGYALVARHVGTDGREAMIMTVDSNPNLIHNLVFEYGLIRWVSHDLFIGKKRAYLTPQVDDVFIDDDMWNTTTHRNNPELDGIHTFRLTGSDLDALVSWQTGFRATLPPGSRYISVMAFNGFGTLSAEFPDQTLLTAALSAGVNLTWLNHTWDHTNMDLMSQADARNEIAQNCDLAAQHHLNGFACSDAVTPDISGLTSMTALPGLVEAGVRYVVSDSSVTAEVAATRGTIAGDNPSFNVGRGNPIDARVYHAPRHPTSIFYDVTTREAEVDEYNTIYRSYWGRDLSYEEIIEVDTSFGLHYLLTGDLDALMFHQTNLKSEVVDGNSHSLFGDWVEATATQFTALVRLPILTLPLHEIAGAMQARAALDACGATATYVEAGAARMITLRSTGTCEVPITGVSSTAGTVELYGSVPTTHVALTAGITKNIPLY